MQMCDAGKNDVCSDGFACIWLSVFMDPKGGNTRTISFGTVLMGNMTGVTLRIVIGF